MSRLIKAFALVAGFMTAGPTYAVQEDRLSEGNFEHTVQNDAALSLTGTVHPEKAQELFVYARLPVEIEQKLKRQETMETISASLASELPENADYNILRHKNSTALVVYDRDQETIHVSFDGGNERADIIDDLKFLKRTHPLGGKVHRGYYGAILKENSEGISLIDAVRYQVESYASETPEKTNISLTGFSRGGSMAVVAAGHWFAEDFFDKNNLSLSHLYSFGNPPGGDKTFIHALTQKISEHHVDAALIIAGRDPIPHILTETSPWYYPNRFGHVGNTVYIGVDADNTFHTAISPDREGIKNFRRESKKTEWHDMDVYSDMLRRSVSEQNTGLKLSSPQPRAQSTKDNAPR